MQFKYTSKGVTIIPDCLLLQEDLNHVTHWADLWQMELNPEKSKVLSIGNCKINFDYTLQGGPIEKLTLMKDIGVTVQSNLKFTRHCTDIIKKAHFVLRNILIHLNIMALNCMLNCTQPMFALV